MGPELQLVFWVAFSVMIGIAAVAFIYRADDDQSRESLEVSDVGGLIAEVGLFLYNVGLPFLALITGALSHDLIGLGTDWFSGDHVAGFTPLDWLRNAGAAAIAVVFVLIVLWLAARSSTSSSSPGNTQQSFLFTLRDAAYDEVHWAFYRSPFILLFNDAYWGTVAGFGLVLIEWVGRAIVRGSSSWHDRRQLLVLICCMLTSGVLYLATRNLWLMIGSDLAIRWVGERLIPAIPAMPSTTASPPRASWRSVSRDRR